MSTSFKEDNIPIGKLCLWDENARFPDKYYNTNELDLINYFLSKNDFKIRTLIEEVVKDFDLPQLEKLVVWNDDDKYVVLEGNRRLTAYKLLCSPELVVDPSLNSFLAHQKSKVNISIDFTLECLVTENKDEGLRYIDRKHANGNNEVNWQDSERALYNVRRGSKNQTELLKIGITRMVKSLEIPEELKDQILGKGYVTTFFRIVTSSAAKSQYGFEFDHENNLLVRDPDFGEKLKVIILNVLKKEDFQGKKIDSRSLNKSGEQESYIKSIEKTDVAKVDQEIKKSTTEDIFGEKNIRIADGRKPKVLPKSTNRSFLIANSCRLSITETKINNVYRELRDDLLLDDSMKAVPNAVSVLFRVFLEISIDYFLEKEGINLSSDTKLSGKITKCTQILETKKIATSKQLVNIRKVATDKNNILGIQNFHDYVHSYKANPTSNDLKQKWDNLQEFFELLWDYLYRKSIHKTNKAA
jgi:hypothetical protein